MNPKYDRNKRSAFQGRKTTARPASETGMKAREAEPVRPGLIRLNKFIANSGVCSRRQADKHIEAGLVTVNGTVVTNMGAKVSPNDVVKFNGERLKPEKPVYILMNKPRDYITTVRDPGNRKTVLTLLGRACPERLFPVGRLDRNTTGVLLLTNDGDLAKKLSHPRYRVAKVYHVFLDKNLKPGDMKTLIRGIELEDGFINADEIGFPEPTDKTQVGIEIHSGRNHIVRRMFEQLNYRVLKLDRVYFAGLTKKGLPRGRWRYLSEKELQQLKMGIFK